MAARSTPSVLPSQASALQYMSSYLSDHKSYRYALGLVFILLQCIVWIVAAVITQQLYEDDLAPPFVLTYVGMSLLAVLLPIQYAKDKYFATTGKTNKSTTPSIGVQDLQEAPTMDTLDVQLANAQGCNDYVAFANASTHQLSTDHVRVWNHRRHITAALWLAPAMFGADYLFNQALRATSVASATVLVSTQSLFVFILAALLRLEQFSVWKLLGVIAGLAGTALTAWDDVQQEDDSSSSQADSSEHAIAGDLCAVGAAVMYAVYTVKVKKFCPENEDLYSMSLLLGYIGLICMVAMAPIGLYLVATHVQWSWLLIGIISTKGLMDFMITDYCLFRAIVLTNATVATVGLGLTIPMAFVTDFAMGKMETVTAKGVCGALAVAIGFLVVNLVPEQHDNSTDEKVSKTGELQGDYPTARQQLV